MVLERFNLLQPDHIHTLERKGIHYLIVSPLHFYQSMRLGDLTIMTTLLLNIKRKLIELYPERFNNYNLFFLYNRMGKSFVNMDDLVLYAPHVYHHELVELDKATRVKYNVSQVLPRIHNWHVPMLYRRFNLTIEEKDHYPFVPLLPRRTKVFNSVGRKDVVILPVTGKDYHKDRNLTYKMLINLIKTLPNSYENILIITKDDYKWNIPRIKRATGRNVQGVGRVLTLSDIVDLVTERCHLYIGGDCGFSHLISNMYNAPDNQIIFLNTTFKEDVHLDKFKRLVVNKPISDKLLVGIDDMNYIDFRPLSIYNKNVIFQSNLDGTYLKHGFLGKTQSTLRR